MQAVETLIATGSSFGEQVSVTFLLAGATLWLAWFAFSAQPASEEEYNLLLCEYLDDLSGGLELDTALYGERCPNTYSRTEIKQLEAVLGRHHSAEEPCVLEARAILANWRGEYAEAIEILEGRENLTRRAKSILADALGRAGRTSEANNYVVKAFPADTFPGMWRRAFDAPTDPDKMSAYKRLIDAYGDGRIRLDTNRDRVEMCKCLLNYAKLCEESGDADEALEIASRAKNIANDLAKNGIIKRNYAAAATLDAAEYALKTKPEDPYEIIREIDIAIFDLEEAADECPYLIAYLRMAHSAKGMTLLLFLKEYERAVDEFTIAIEEVDQHVYSALEQYEKQKLLESRIRSLRQRGLANWKRGQLEEAMQDLEEAIALAQKAELEDCKLAALFLECGRYYGKLGSCAQALQRYESGDDLSGECGVSLKAKLKNNIAWALATCGDASTLKPEIALRYAEEAADLLPET